MISSEIATPNKLYLALSILLLLAFGCSQQQPALNIGDTPPTFAPADLQGRRVRVPDDFKGKVVVIRFWADNCPACAEEMPQIELIYRRYREKGLAVLAVNVGQTENIVSNFVHTRNISYPVLLDPFSIMKKTYGVEALPTTYFLDRKGVIRFRIIGAERLAVFTALIKTMLEE